MVMTLLTMLIVKMVERASMMMIPSDAPTSRTVVNGHEWVN
jgi:hypothetical protein